MSEIKLAKSWRSAPELDQLIGNLSQNERFCKIASLSLFVKRALYSPTYNSRPDWAEAVRFTPAGLELYEQQKSVHANVDISAITMAIFGILYHHDLLIDIEQTDLAAIQNLIQDDISGENVKTPYIFGRYLYDKFNDEYSESRTDHLLPDESWDLLKNTPTGVYQVGHIVIGPLGLFETANARYFPPVLKLNLWHCSDPGCQAVHAVELIQHDVPVVLHIKNATDHLRNAYGPPSEWRIVIPRLLGPQSGPLPYTYFDICALIGDAIVGQDRTSLLTSVLNGKNGNVLRDTLSRLLRTRRGGQGSGDSIARSLQSEEQLQLLFALPNDVLVEELDRIVTTGNLKIPLTEVRAAKISPPASADATTSELSSLGVRCSGDESLLDLWALLWDGYKTANMIGDLDWRLRNRLGSATENLLLDFICKNHPRNVVKELVLSSEPITSSLCERIGCAVDHSNESEFIDKILWKIGFDLPRFSDNLEILRRRLEVFNTELLAVAALDTERDRERIRSAGVNLFVSIEEFLDILISYNIWLLGADHFGHTKFRYEAKLAHEMVPSILGPTIKSGDSDVSWSIDRTNALGSLVAYLAATTKWMQALLSSSREPCLRPADDMPHFADFDFRVFPFRHTALWADCNNSGLQRMVEGFGLLANKVQRSNIAGIRNGLDHHRDPENFPTINEMLAFVAHFREAVDNADINRYFPKELWYVDLKVDRFGKEEYTFSDYAGRAHIFYGPSVVLGIPGVVSSLPAIVAPGNLLGFANADLVFRSRVESSYANYWAGYPRRRRIPRPNLEDFKGPDPDEIITSSKGRDQGQPETVD